MVTREDSRLIGLATNGGYWTKCDSHLGITETVKIYPKAPCRGGWGKAPMWGKGPTTEITFMDGNRGNICTRVFSYVIGPPVAVVADGENTS